MNTSVRISLALALAAGLLARPFGGTAVAASRAKPKPNLARLKKLGALMRRISTPPLGPGTAMASDPTRVVVYELLPQTLLLLKAAPVPPSPTPVPAAPGARAGAVPAPGAPSGVGVGSGTGVPDPGLPAFLSPLPLSPAAGLPPVLYPSDWLASLSAAAQAKASAGKAPAVPAVPPLAVPSPAPAALLASALAAEGALTAAPSPTPVAAAPGAAALAPAATAAADAPQPPAFTPEGLARLKEMLQPLLGVEYPSRALFEGAVDAALVRYARSLAQAAALDAQRPPLDAARLAAISVPDWARVRRPRTAAAIARIGSRGRVPLRDLTAYLLPYAWREWIISQARMEHPLGLAAPVLWGGAGGVYLGRLAPVMGFYPLWKAAKTAQNPDFGLLQRVSLFAFPIDDRGSVVAPDPWTPGMAAFLAGADLHRTRVDLTLYRRDWRMLAWWTPAQRGNFAATLARSARALLDEPLPDPVQRLEAHLPLYARPHTLAQGVTLWLVPPKGPAAPRRLFPAFYAQIVDALIRQLGRDGRPLRINLVVCDTRYFADPAFSLRTLKRLADEAERPDPATCAPTTGLTLRLITPLYPPVRRSSELMRGQIIGTADRIGAADSLPCLLEKIVPLIFLADGVPAPSGPDGGETPGGRLKRDLGSVDSFYSAAFWPAPMGRETLPQDLATLLWRSNFVLDGAARPMGFTLLVARYRWPLRAAFEVLALLALLALPFLLRLRLGDLDRKVQLGLWGGLALLVAAGGLLLEGDPALVRLRQGNVPLWILVGILAAGALFAILKPRVEEP